MSDILAGKGFKFNIGIINIILLFASTGGVWVFEYSKELNIFCTYVVLLSLLILHKQRVSANSFYVIISFFIVSAVLLTHYLVLNASSQIDPSNYVNLCIRLMYVALLFIYLDMAKIDIMKCFRWALTAVFIHSLFNFVLLQFIIPHELLRPYGHSEAPAYTFLYIFYYWQASKVMDLSFIRSQGIFWEPGVLQ